MHRDCLEQRRKKELLSALLTGNPHGVWITASEYLTNSGTIQHFQADLRKQPDKVSLWLSLSPASFWFVQLDFCFYMSNRMLLGFAHSSFQSCPRGPSPGPAVKNLKDFHAVVLVILYTGNWTKTRWNEGFSWKARAHGEEFQDYHLQ